MPARRVAELLLLLFSNKDYSLLVSTDCAATSSSSSNHRSSDGSSSSSSCRRSLSRRRMQKLQSIKFMCLIAFVCVTTTHMTKKDWFLYYNNSSKVEKESQQHFRSSNSNNYNSHHHLQEQHPQSRMLASIVSLQEEQEKEILQSDNISSSINKQKEQQTTKRSCGTTTSTTTRTLEYTCSEHKQRYPTLQQDCQLDPFLPQCNMNCMDPYIEAPSPPESSSSSSTSTSSGSPNDCSTSNQNKHPQLWPPLGQGEWVQDEKYCQEHKDTTRNCFANNMYRWILSSDDACQEQEQDDDNDDDSSRSLLSSLLLQPMDRHAACTVLQDRNITHVRFAGDSMIRMMYQAFVLIMTDNPYYDVTHHGRKCLGAAGWMCQVPLKQNQKHEDSAPSVTTTVYCPQQQQQQQQKRHPIHIHFYQNLAWHPQHMPLMVPEKDDDGNEDGKTLHLYGVGNWPVLNDRSLPGRQTILNATAWRTTKWNTFEQEPYFYGKDHYFLWIPPHYRFSVTRADESNDKALQFLHETHQFFTGVAKVTGTLNTYTMTQKATQYLTRTCNTDDDNHGVVTNPKTQCKYYHQDTCQDATYDTWDGIHYGKDINLWKAQLALKHLEMLVPV